MTQMYHKLRIKIFETINAISKNQFVKYDKIFDKQMTIFAQAQNHVMH